MAWRNRSTPCALAALALLLAATPALAQKQYGPGVTDTEIKIGTTTPFSGPASAYSAGAISATAYFAMVNQQGGVNGRKINYISLDDAYSPPKTVEQIRRLIESDEVLFLVNPVGTATNMAVVKYINQKKVPHLFIGSGATVFNDPEHYPWTMSWTPHYASEGEIYAKYILSVRPGAKIGILSQNDDLGRDYLLGFKRALGDKASTMIVSSLTYNTSDPTIDCQRRFVDCGRDQAGRVRSSKRHHFRRLSKGPGRPAVARRSGNAGLERLDGQVQPARRQKRLLRSLRLQCRFRGGPAAETMRRQSYPRKYHEAGFPSGHGAAVAAAWDPPEDQLDGPAPDQTNAAGAF